MDEPIQAINKKPAGFWIRILASFVDFVILCAIWLIGYYVTSGNILLFMIINLPLILYKPLMESTCGATLGKLLCRIEVLGSDYFRISVAQSYVRSIPFLLFYVAYNSSYAQHFDRPPYLSTLDDQAKVAILLSETMLLVKPFLALLIIIDCMFVAFRKDKRALHDFFVNTICVYKMKKRVLNITNKPYNKLNPYPLTSGSQINQFSKAHKENLKLDYKADNSPSVKMKRPLIISILCIFYFIFTLFCYYWNFGICGNLSFYQEQFALNIAKSVLLFIVPAVIYVFSIIGYWRMKPWGVYLFIILIILGPLVNPVWPVENIFMIESRIIGTVWHIFLILIGYHYIIKSPLKSKKVT